MALNKSKNYYKGYGEALEDVLNAFKENLVGDQYYNNQEILDLLEIVMFNLNNMDYKNNN